MSGRRQFRGPTISPPAPGLAIGYGRVVPGFETPLDLTFNRGLIADPEAFARDAKAASWLYLCGEDFAAVEGGMSYADVQAAVTDSANIVSDPPVVLDMELARGTSQHSTSSPDRRW